MTDYSKSKFQDIETEEVWSAVLDSLWDDMVTVTACDVDFYRVGNVIAWEDDQGFVWSINYGLTSVAEESLNSVREPRGV